MATPDSAPEATWPTTFASPAIVAQWIAGVLPGRRAEVTGPTRVYQAAPWVVTAQFTVRAPSSLPDTVVFKASALDLAGSAPRVYELLREHCSAHTPRLLASDRRDGQTWMLFATFHGEPIRAEVERLAAVARTLAGIQTTLAALPPTAFDGIARTDVRALPGLFPSVLGYINEKYATYWSRQDGPRAELMPGVPQALARAATYNERIAAWAAELAAGAWPDSLDHPDLHTGNALVQPNGQILIYDWEEATVSCPFFSMDEVLANTREIDAAHDVSVLGADGQRGESWETRVRDAYRDTLPWGTQTARERGFELAMALLPVKKAHEYIQTDYALGRVDGNRHLTAILFDALRRWERFT